jgi:hypothetical protein
MGAIAIWYAALKQKHRGKHEPGEKVLPNWFVSFVVSRLLHHAKRLRAEAGLRRRSSRTAKGPSALRRASWMGLNQILC